MTDLTTMTPSEAFLHALFVLNRRWPEAEPLIMTNPWAARCYARDVRKAPWPEAEPVIITDPWAAYRYARDVREAPWPEAEPIIKDSIFWDDYVKHFNIKEKEMNNLIKAIITLNNGTEFINEFTSSLEAEQWRSQLGYNSGFLCVNIEKPTYIKMQDIQSITFNKSLIEMGTLAREEAIQRDRAYNAQLSQMAGNLQGTAINRS